LKDSCRIVICYSSTDPLARVMIEAGSENLADAIRTELGA
jgi:phosphomannomutase